MENIKQHIQELIKFSEDYLIEIVSGCLEDYKNDKSESKKNQLTFFTGILMMKINGDDVNDSLEQLDQIKTFMDLNKFTGSRNK